MDREELRSKVKTFIARILAEMAPDSIPLDMQMRVEEMLTRASDIFTAMIDSGQLSEAELPKFEESVRVLVRHAIDPQPTWLPTRTQMELLAFAEQLATRQGTQIPNWDEFYAERDALECRIRELNSGDSS